MKFKGILPALVTPLCENESINRTVPEQLPEHLLGKGADCFYIAGATGEGLALRPSERRGLAVEAVRIINHRKPCIQRGGKKTIALAIREAERTG